MYDNVHCMFGDEHRYFAVLIKDKGVQARDLPLPAGNRKKSQMLVQQFGSKKIYFVIFAYALLHLWRRAG